MTTPPVHPLDEQVKKLVVPATACPCSELDGMALTSDSYLHGDLHRPCRKPRLVLTFDPTYRTHHQGASSSDLWMAIHRGRITSSSFHDVLVRKDSTPPDNLVKRLMLYEVFRGSAATEHGKRHEDHARRTYRSYMNCIGHTGLTA